MILPFYLLSLVLHAPVAKVKFGQILLDKIL
ncbi:unnamed protein product, partial [marine sediment metagenome]